MDENQTKYFIEAALLAAGGPLTIDQLQNLFNGGSVPEKSQIRQAIKNLLEDYRERGITIKEVASGFRIQVVSSMAERLQKLWEERPPRYSRALFETLALIAYRQPMTRGEIEEIRGVAVSSNIVRTLLEREWIRVVGHRDVPGRPAMFGTTRQFLDYFGLKKLEDLPPLADLSDWESLRVQLHLPDVTEADIGEEDRPTGAAVAAIPVHRLHDDHPEEEYLADSDADVEQPAEDAAGIDESGAGGEPAPAETGDEFASSGTEDFEPIEATKWPAAGSSDASVEAAQADGLDEAEDEAGKTGASLPGG